MEKILLLEDDSGLADGLMFALRKQGYEVDASRTIAGAKTAWHSGAYDLLILDVSLPDGSGFDFCRFVRQRSDVPIIFLTASDEETNVIMGLDIGGDDYVTKPFRLGILLSRVSALLRRAKTDPAENTTLESNGIRIELLGAQVFCKGALIDLTGVEFKLLCCFMQNPNIVLSKQALYARLWDRDGYFVDNPKRQQGFCFRDTARRCRKTEIRSAQCGRQPRWQDNTDRIGRNVPEYDRSI